jgi:hypothetical protein
MIIKKIIFGFVTQTYDTSAKKYTEQNFTAGDQVDWENEFGESLYECPPKDYLPFDMVQPN